MKRSKTGKKWSKKEMRAHGFSIGYYGGWYVDLKAPKGLTRDEHDAYLSQKAALINSLGNPARKIR